MFKISENNVCSFCQKEEKTYEHLFYLCEKIRTLWVQYCTIILNSEHTVESSPCWNRRVKHDEKNDEPHYSSDEIYKYIPPWRKIKK